MAKKAEPFLVKPPDVHLLVTEDDTPVDGFFQEKEMRLLVEPLHSFWRPRDAGGAPLPFLVASDVGVFDRSGDAIVPDVLVALNVKVPEKFWRKDRRSYYLWEFRKPPDIVVEIVSNREGDEFDDKRARYSKLGVKYYVVFDHLKLRGDKKLYIYTLRGDLLVPTNEVGFPEFGLSLTQWEGTFEDCHAEWLRWCTLDGTLIPTGKEQTEIEAAQRQAAQRQATKEKHRAEKEKRRADHAEQQMQAEKHRADQAEQHIAQLMEKLRQLGGKP